MDIIEISSSPEPEEAGPSRARNPPNRPRHLPGDVIEITDSEEEEEKHAYSSKKITVNTRQSPGGSTSRTKVTKTVRIFAGDRDPSRPPSPKRRRTNANPLFLHSDDENESAPPGSPPEIDDNFPVFEDLPPPPKTKPRVVVESIETCLARVLEIVPDVQPEHAFQLLETRIPTDREKAVENVLHMLFEDPSYPKIDKKGKRKRDLGDPEELGESANKLDYSNKDRPHKGGLDYADLALNQLLIDFPYIPKPHVRAKFFEHNGLYAPTHIFLAQEKLQAQLPYTPKTLPSRSKGKTKAGSDAEFEREREWLLHHLFTSQRDGETADEQDDAGECENGIECGCCFSAYSFEKMIQCPDAHLFCKPCMKTYASTLLGAHDDKIVCMDQSGCKLAFPESELRRFLTTKLMELYERVKQRKCIEAAELEGLEECPFCDYKVVIDNPDEKLFRCENADCEAVTCRACKKPDHLPKSCKEVEDDKRLDARHTIEEAMTRALMRNCPKCQKAFVKEMGCNKMTCPHCRTLSCYICRKVINGYDHFGNQQQNGIVAPGKCPLWDGQPERRHAEEVAEAARKAREEYKRDHPEVDEKDIEVDVPPPVPQAGPAQPLGPPMLAHIPHIRHHRHQPRHVHIPPAYPALQANILQLQHGLLRVPPGLGVQLQFNGHQLQQIHIAHQIVHPRR